MFHQLAIYFTHAFFTRYTQSLRGAPPEVLLDLWQRASSAPATTHKAPLDAWQAASAMAGPDDLICTTGSVFLAGELRPTLLAR